MEYTFSPLEGHDAPFEETIFLQTDWGVEVGGHQAKNVKPIQVGENPSLYAFPYQEGEVRG